MLNSDFIRQKWEQGLTFDAYVATGNPEQQKRWTTITEVARLSEAQASLIASFTREMHLLVVSGVWCGDCIEQVPLLHRIAEANPRLHLGLLDRDLHKDLSDQLKLNGGARVPTVVLASEDFELCGFQGDRTLSRYRSIAEKQLGASCSIGLHVPPAEKLAANLQDWLDEVERVQLMLRLSARLRQRHGD